MKLLPWQSEIWQDLDFRIEAGRLPHALLLHGPQGVGKRRLAQALTQRLLCLTPTHGHACGECRSCQLSVPGGAHPDWTLLAPAEEKNAILVDQVRELCTHLSLSAAFSGRRVGLIEAADAMNTNAANALLKTLEEPGADVHIILVADRLGRLPTTVRSRCQQVFCPSPSQELALPWLINTITEGGFGSAQFADPLQALVLAGGGPLLALEYLTQGVVGEAQQVRGDLYQLALSTQPDPFSVWQAWQEIPPPRLWRWVLLSLHHWACAQALFLPTEGERFPLSAQQNRALLQLSQAAQHVLRLTATPVRDELQCWYWLLQWIESGPTQVNHGTT